MHQSKAQGMAAHVQQGFHWQLRKQETHCTIKVSDLPRIGSGQEEGDVSISRKFCCIQAAAQDPFGHRE